MMNTVNSGSLETLKFGDTLITKAIKVEGGKVQIEFAEIIRQADGNILQMFNQSDARFSSKGRRAWLTAEPKDAAQHLGVPDIADLSKYTSKVEGEKATLSLNILNPVVNGSRLRVQITETTIPTAWDAANVETRAKRRGAGGEYITHNGQYIFTRTDLVLNEPVHTFLKADVTAQQSVAAKNIDFSTGEIFS